MTWMMIHHEQHRCLVTKPSEASSGEGDSPSILQIYLTTRYTCETGRKNVPPFHPLPPLTTGA